MSNDLLKALGKELTKASKQLKNQPESSDPKNKYAYMTKKQLEEQRLKFIKLLDGAVMERYISQKIKENEHFRQFLIQELEKYE